MFLIDKQSNKAIPMDKASFSELGLHERRDFQKWIVDDPKILGENLLIIAEEFAGFDDTRERLDVLAIDELGRLVVVENKTDDSGRDVVWQALKYASYCATLTKNQICEIFSDYIGDFELAQEKIAELCGQEQAYEDVRLNEGNQRIILVAANFRKEVTSTVLWLREYHNVDITCIKVALYKDGERIYLDAEQILPVPDIGDYQIRIAEKRREDVVLSKEETLRDNMIFRFWERALPVMREKTGIFQNVAPTKRWWIEGASGHAGITFFATITQKGARAELYIGTRNKDENKRIFSGLHLARAEIDALFPGKFVWRELPEKTASCISIYFKDYGWKDEENWDKIIGFLAENIADLMTAFKEPLGKVMGSK
ncbi:MAG: DUF4268 domain-containing protein [Clostridiales bacterium]|jgi:hypothetical protein|nr:DUF4268 domain-containing protein [Clostridiales bacterium]